MHFMTVCLASRLFPLLICLPSGRVHVGKSSRLPWPQSRLSGCEVCRPSWAASHMEMTGAVLSPPSAECAAAFLCLTFQGSFLVKTLRGCARCGFFFFFFFLANLHIRELHQFHPFGFLHIFLKLQSVSFATYQLGLDGTQFYQKFRASRNICGPVLFLTPNQTAGPLSNHNSRACRCQSEEVDGALLEAVVLLLLYSPPPL